MRLLLIRHGETVDNIQSKLAGVTDSALTQHGKLQIERLGQALAKAHGSFEYIYSSDLTRAKETAEGILTACKKQGESASDEKSHHGPVTELTVLREKDFGSLELTSFRSGSQQDPQRPAGEKYVQPESQASIDARADCFIGDYLAPLFVVEPESKVAVVSHGIMLSHLWKRLLLRSGLHVRLADDIQIGPRGLAHLGSWSNTGYLELDVNAVTEDIKDEKAEAAEKTINADATLSMTANDGDQTRLSTSSSMSLEIRIIAVNSTTHLSSLKRTRGVGSAAYDPQQKSIEGFFKRRKPNPGST